MSRNVENNGDGSGFFWGEISPCEHIVQIYEDDELFFDTLVKFVIEGLEADEGVIVLATTNHLNVLEQRLIANSIDIESARSRDQYVACDGEEIMGKFLVNDWPDEALFEQTVTELLARASSSGRRVRAFGEIVAIMWERGYNGATINLEHLWHKLVQKKQFPLYCAYPKSGFTKKSADGIRDICAAHSKVLDGNRLKSSAEFSS